MELGFRHLIVKKREQSASAEPPSFKKYLLDEVAYMVGIATALANIPQLLQIWVGRDADGVSTFSWSAFALGTVFWLYYSSLHKERAMVVTFSLVLIFQVMIMLGSIIY
jgi:uncharacterized protein with PQ loop repeat